MTPPQRGDIIWIDLNPHRGHEQAGRRPVLVLSNSRYNALTHLVVVCPITQQVENYPTEVPLSTDLKTTGVVLAGQIRTLDWSARGFEPIEAAPDGVLRQVLDLIVTVLEP